jgi:hypothetical protein
MVVCGGQWKVFCQTQVTDNSPLVLVIYVKIYLSGTFRISHPTSQQEE